jgi:hypothetical protein
VVTCKRAFAQELAVRNWLDSYQRFRVIIEVEDKDPSVSVTGSPSMDVPGLLERKYKLAFYAYKEGITKAKITFMNDATGESLVFNVVFKAVDTDDAAIDSLPDFETPIRTQQERTLAIANPLDIPAIFHEFVSSDPNIFVPNLPITCGPHSEANFTVQYRPLVATKQKDATLKLKSNVLGEFKFDLALTANPVGAPRVMKFATGLGGEVSQTHRFLSYASKSIDYECKVTGTDFTLESGAKVTASPCPPGGEGVEVLVELRYEPSALGTVKETVTFSNTEGGTYQLALEGFCDPPKPQGPVQCKLNAASSVKFKNVYESTEDFLFSVDNPAFQLAKKTEKLNRKTTVAIAVSYKPADGSGAKGKGKGKESRPTSAAPTANPIGKLLVTCPNTGATWIYYLQGEP